MVSYTLATAGSQHGIQRSPKFIIDRNVLNEEGTTALIRAVADRDIKRVQNELHHEGVNPNAAAKSSWTPLLQAAFDGQKEIVYKLLRHKSIDPNIRNESGSTPLILAACAGHVDVVKELLRAKDINLNAQDETKGSALSHAARLGNREVLQLLLQEKGIDFQIQDGIHRTPLSYASESGCKEAVQLLLQTKGTEINGIDQDGRTPLSYAAEKGNEEIVQMLLDTKDIDVIAEDKEGRTPLLFAAEHGSMAVVRMLARATSYQNRTLMSWAAEHGHITCIRSLLQIGEIDPRSNDTDGRTPLFRALENGHRLVARELAPLDAATLHTLVEEDSRDLVRRLLDFRQDVVHIKDSQGQTPLHIAIRHKRTEVVEDLITSKADINSKRSDGTTPLQLAIRWKHLTSIEILLKKGVQVTGVSIKDWIEAYGKDAQHVKVELSEDPDDSKRLCFSERKPADVLAATGASRTLLSLYTRSGSETKSSIQSLLAACPGSAEFLRDSHTAASVIHMFNEKIESDKKFLIYLATRYPIRSPSQSQHFEPDWELCSIAWTIVPPSKEENDLEWRSVAHVSMLPNGWLPDDGVEFFRQFMRYLQDRWIELCDSAEEHMSNQRRIQLQEKGENHDLIQHLAEDALQWDRLRRVLRFEVLAAQEFAKKQFKQYNAVNAFKAQEAIESFSDEVASRLSLLDQTVRDLLQFEFAWASINEAHKSTSLATSMKRLSWITFVFLPAMFASSLFGMNVDILASNPDWRWYILFVSVILAITILGWLLFKYGQIEQWTERHIGARISRLGKIRKGQGSGQEDADPRF